MLLITLGGIGFLVIREVLDLSRKHLGRDGHKVRLRMSLHSKVVLLTSAFLIVYGAVGIGCLEMHGALSGMSFMEGVITSYSIHYTKLYEMKAVSFFLGLIHGDVRLAEQGFSYNFV